LPVTACTRSPYSPSVIRRTCAAVVVAAALLAGCSSSGSPAAGALHPRWHEVALPMPSGPSGRIALRAATACGDTWYVVGAIVGTDGSTRPAAWTSLDGRDWRSITTAPADYYSRRAILYAVACQGGQVVAIGAKSGGAHGNPRTATWRLRDDGVLAAVTASFVLYGGAHALSVNRVAGGPAGWVIAGSRSSGAAVWVSPDGAAFRIVDHDPELASNDSRTTSALDVFYDGSAWTAVGRAEQTGRVSAVPQAWVSTDGARWTAQAVPPGTDGFADLERVVREDEGLLAVGIRDHRLGTWRRTGGSWHPTESFGSLDRHGTGAPFVSGLAAAGGTAVVTASDGALFRLWALTSDRPSARAWRPVATPTRPANNGDDLLTVAADDSSVLLLSDDGTSGRAWLTPWNTLGR
jgi:hypothetical protein